MSASQLSEIFLDAPLPVVSGFARTISPLSIVNTYGLFAVMTTSRPEIVVQGSRDGVVWRDYEFRFKPGNLKIAPRFVAPYQPRLDWQMWFAALAGAQQTPWFGNFLAALLEGSPPVISLMAGNPFPEGPPKYVRALRFRYDFTSRSERSATGDWWKREPQGTYFPPVTIEDIRR
jgi:hypothetical protein